jgi:hypothetical protein
MEKKVCPFGFDIDECLEKNPKKPIVWVYFVSEFLNYSPDFETLIQNFYCEN